jgi:DNA-binding response OmpR family regulator
MTSHPRPHPTPSQTRQAPPPLPTLAGVEITDRGLLSVAEALQAVAQAITGYTLISKSPELIPVITIGNLTIDTERRTVLVNDEPIHLCRREYGLLVRLARADGRAVTKTTLLADVWGRTDPPYGRAGRTVDTHASRVRRRLVEAGAQAYVDNVFAEGYRLVI